MADLPKEVPQVLRINMKKRVFLIPTLLKMVLKDGRKQDYLSINSILSNEKQGSKVLSAARSVYS